MNLNTKINKVALSGLVVFTVLYIGLFVVLPEGLNVDFSLFLWGVLICGLIALPTIFIENKESGGLKYFIKFLVWFLLIGLLSMFWYLVQSILMLYLPSETQTYEQNIEYVTKLTGTKQGIRCRNFVQWKDSKTNNWLEYCISSEIYEKIKHEKSINATIKLRRNYFGILIEKVYFH